MAESPTKAEVVQECATIEQYITTSFTMSDYISSALAEVKRYLRNKRGVEWSTVYNSTTSEYFLDTDDNANNKDNLIKAISLMTVAIIYKAQAQEARDSIWWNLYQEYLAEVTNLMDTAKLDIDSDESGDIAESEENATAQVFFRL